MMDTSMLFRCLLVLVSMILVESSESSSSSSSASSSALESCRAAGFDPSQLACSTCDLLPEGVIEKCKSCCLSYKTLEKRTQRYQAAVVTHAERIASYFPEVSNMIKEDWDGLIELKGGNRLILKDTSDSPQAPRILWFQGLPENADSMTVGTLEQLAPEIVVLTGWKRDDSRNAKGDYTRSIGKY